MALLFPVPSPIAVAPIRVAALPALEVIPYMANRVALAQAAAQALLRKTYRRVLVDLPAFMQNAGWMRGALGMLPHVSAVAFDTPDGESRAIPVSPANASIAAAVLAMTTGTSVRCIDVPDLLNFPAGALLWPDWVGLDDSRLARTDLEEFFAVAWNELFQALGVADEQRRFFTRYRAAGAAALIRQAAADGRATLLLCEARLWPFVRKALERHDPPPARFLFQHKVPKSATVVVMDPVNAWLADLLDDAPALVLSHWRALFPKDAIPGVDVKDTSRNIVALPLAPQARDRFRTLHAAQSVERWAKGRVLDALLCGALEGDGESPVGRELGVSVRSAVAFAAYLRRRSASSSRALPRVWDEIVHAANACGGRGFAVRIVAALLDYPEPPNIPSAKGVSRGWLDLKCAYDDRKLFAFDALGGDDSSPSAAKLRILALAQHMRRSRSAFHAPVVAAVRGTMYAVREDYVLHAQITEQAIDLLQRNGSARPLPVDAGYVGDGIAWKAMLAARAQGDQRVYAYARRPRGATGIRGPASAVPIVFYLDSDDIIAESQLSAVVDHNRAMRAVALGRDPGSEPPDFVYSVVMAVQSAARREAGHLRIERLSALALGYPSRAMGPDRFEKIVRRPQALQCRTVPWDDPQLCRYSKSALLLAWAIKYAQSAVIVVARRGWRASPPLAQYARSRRIALQTVPLSMFTPEQIDGLRHFHTMSGAMKQQGLTEGWRSGS